MPSERRRKSVGRPRGSGFYPVALPPVRLTPEQLAKLEAQPGISLADKLRRVLDLLPAQ